MIRTILTGVSALSLAAGAAYAQDIEQPEPIETMETMEAETASAETAAQAPALDATTVTTKDDARLFAVTEFNIVDANADGKIDQAEFVAYSTANAEAAKAKAKTEAENEAVDGEGDITVAAAEEIEAPAPEVVFAEISEGDDAIDQIEMVEARVADFEEADVNDDEQLDEVEKIQFAALVIGK